MTGLESKSNILKSDSSRISKVGPLISNDKPLHSFLEVFYLGGDKYGKNNNGKNG